VDLQVFGDARAASLHHGGAHGRVRRAQLVRAGGPQPSSGDSCGAEFSSISVNKYLFMKGFISITGLLVHFRHALPLLAR
jgi:hypothetical protein